MINLKTNLLTGALCSLVLSPFLVKAQNNETKPDKPNVLFIAVDDLRPELGCYGKSMIKSPNIDRLAKMGVIFTNAYANYPQCHPSRASLMSGIYPSDKRFTGGKQDTYVPGVVSLPMHFKNNHYKTISLGKVYHYFDDGKGSWDKNWRPPIYTTKTWDYQATESIRIFEERNIEYVKSLKRGPHPFRGPAYENPDVPDIAYEDGRIAVRAIEELQELQNSGDPFFLAVGFKKPHLPFNAPKKYWDLYDKKDIKIPSNYHLPKNAPDAAKFNWPELRHFYGIPQEGPVEDTTAVNLIHGYYACVSYIDAMVGLVINALEDLGLAENTIIMLWGDHGWFLGEHGFWTKHSNLKRGPHVPLILKVPWKDAGIKTDALVEYVDIYPTLCELTGISLPVHLQGKSFAPLIDDPEKPWKEAVFYRMGKGETILTKTHAYTEWINYQTGETNARMLYDHRTDPEENVNVSELPENKELNEKLHESLHNHLKNRDKIELEN